MTQTHSGGFKQYAKRTTRTDSHSWGDWDWWCCCSTGCGGGGDCVLLLSGRRHVRSRGGLSSSVDPPHLFLLHVLLPAVLIVLYELFPSPVLPPQQHVCGQQFSTCWSEEIPFSGEVAGAGLLHALNSHHRVIRDASRETPKN